MRIAVVGAGTSGVAHARRLAAQPDVTEILMASRDPERARTAAEQVPGARPATPDEAFAAGVDGVAITASTASHAPLLHRALGAEIPVFTEKPVALDVPTTREVVAHAAERPHVPVHVGFQRRFDSGFRRAREAVQAGHLGFVHTVHSTTLDLAPPPPGYVATSGGIFKDCAVHDFDAIAWVTGRRAVRLWASGTVHGDDAYAAACREHGDLTSASVLVTYDDGMVGLVSVARHNAAGHDVRLELHGSDGARFVGLDDKAPLVTAQDPGTLHWQQDTPYQIYLERFADAFDAELAAFVDVVAGRIPSPCTPAEALETLYLADAAIVSVREQRPVEIDELRG